ncbi:MAG: hypothetical protein ACR2N1_17560 [Rubripirellula sp.]
MNGTATLVILIAGLLLAPTASARKTEAWPYERLFQHADIVVIAVATTSVPNEQKWVEPIFASQRFQGVTTQLRVVSTVKGSPSPTIKLLHYKYADSTPPVNDGPALISFFTGPVSIDVQPLKRAETELKALSHKRLSQNSAPEYLLFLKKRQDGSFEAVSGQVDPSFSVRALFNVEAINNE